MRGLQTTDIRSMKNIAIIIALLFICPGLIAQKSYTKNGSITFFSRSPLENIDAKNNQVMSVLNIATGDLQFSVIISAFHFKKALMEEHFNENYLESTRFPKATFKGVISDVSKIDFTKEGSKKVFVRGDFTMHGVTKKITVAGSLNIKNGISSAESKFTIKLADYNITIPKLVKNNISENIDIIVNCTYDQHM